jgi:hypothetical protein
VESGAVRHKLTPPALAAAAAAAGAAPSYGGAVKLNPVTAPGFNPWT